jgi:hypothetical protein
MIRLNLCFGFTLVLFLFQQAQPVAGTDYGQLGVKTNYPVSLKEIRYEKLEKYDYSEYRSVNDFAQVKCYEYITREKALKIIEDRKFMMNLAFEDQVSPYPGFLSNTIGCPEDLKPKPKEDTLAVSLEYKLLATGNFVYGNCNIKDNYYYSLYEIIYCPSRQELYEMKFFTPVTAPSFNYVHFNFVFECIENR